MATKVVIPKHYSTGKKNLQIQHAGLRTKCSSLNQHLCSKILFKVLSVFMEQLRLFERSRYSLIRPDMITIVSTVGTPSLPLLLSGDGNINIDVFFSIVQTFIGGTTHIIHEECRFLSLSLSLQLLISVYLHFFRINL